MCVSVNGPRSSNVEQRLDRTAGVDHHRVAAELIRHDVGVGQELVVHRALDDHARRGVIGGRLGPYMSLIHTCYRIADIDRSVAFYEALGFEEMGRHPDPRRGGQRLHGPPRRRARAALELTYNLGATEPYDLGTGYGHIAITAAGYRLHALAPGDQGIEPERPPYSVREGGNRLCFVRDPDGYRIELIERDRVGRRPG